ncbi:hypothetical protein [Serratia symbiotica]|uniref:Uncharacterized protein n=1 Tax=Serratia symbiotica TaxID=138074 RepID=A0A7D5ST17_9GAMM|nr:hypothetical protein [Serratia symbiotica]QLH63178.1 hypothetical protein SYMBAF_09875 [Serratia symbiotica]
MAKKPQKEELGGLPPELQVGDQESPETLKVDDQAYDNSDDDEDGEKLPDGMVPVVVTKGNTVRHDGCDYPENRVFTLPVADAQRLIGLGVVADVEQLRKLALLRSAPAVTVQSGE